MKSTNRTVSRFEHNGQKYSIHERGTVLSDGSNYARRFICDASGDWQGWASNVRQARKVLNGEIGRHDLN